MQAPKSRSKAKKNIDFINDGLRKLINNYFKLVSVLWISSITCGGYLFGKAIRVTLVTHCFLVTWMLAQQECMVGKGLFWAVILLKPITHNIQILAVCSLGNTNNLWK